MLIVVLFLRRRHEYSAQLNDTQGRVRVRLGQ